MKFGPSSLTQTRYLMTLLHADYLLKMLLMETEVSSKIPFEMRNANENISKLLPNEIREKIQILRNSKSLSQINRFWIEPLELPYQIIEEGDKIRYKLDYCKMTVRKHQMMVDQNGQFIDDFDSEDEFENISESESIDEADDSDSNSQVQSEYKSGDSDFDSNNRCRTNEKLSPEKRFAMNFTKYYDEIGFYFPILLRLRELLKLSAISIFINNILNQEKQQIINYRKQLFHIFDACR